MFRAQSLFKTLSDGLSSDEFDAAIFVLDDYCEVEGCQKANDSNTRQAFLEDMHRQLGLKTLLVLLHQAVGEINRGDLCDLVWSGISEAEIDDNDLDLRESLSTEVLSTGDNPVMSMDDSLSKTLSPSHPTEESDILIDAHQIEMVEDLQPSFPGYSVFRDSLQASATSTPSRGNSADSGFPSTLSQESRPSITSTSISTESTQSDDKEIDGFMEMTAKEMTSYLDSDLDHNNDLILIGNGGFGKVYKGTFSNKKVAIKIQIQSFIDADGKQFEKERELAFLRNVYLVPVLAYSTFESSNTRMIMYPYMENIDLSKVFDRQNDVDLSVKRKSWIFRIRVLYQCSEALAFLHKPVDGIRNEIIHGDVKPGNILLDAQFNARLGDVGIAVELPPGVTSLTLTKKYGTEGYEDEAYNNDTGEDTKVKRRKENDLFSLGVVGVQLLNWKPAVSEEKKGDRKQKVLLYNKVLDLLCSSSDNISRTKIFLLAVDFWDRAVWDSLALEIREKLTGLILSCLKKKEERITSKLLAKELQELLCKLNLPLYEFSNDSDDLCLNCCFNKPDSFPALIPFSETCRQTSCVGGKKFCKACHKTAFRNPLYCTQHGQLGQLIQKENAYAILVSGVGDASNKDEEEEETTFNNDIENMLNVLIDVKIVGLRKKNTCEINKNSLNKLSDLTKALDNLKNRTVDLLIFYYSGHGNQDDRELNISKDDKANMTDKELKRHLTEIPCSKLLVILDCCNAACYEILPEKHDERHPDGWCIQLNAANRVKTSQMEDEKSIFTRHLIQSLKSAHYCFVQNNDGNVLCHLCSKLKKLSAVRGYIDIYDVIGSCSEHMKLEAEADEDEDEDEDANDQKPHMTASVVTGNAPIARYNETPFKHTFEFQGMIFHLLDLEANFEKILHQLWDKISELSSLPAVIPADWCPKILKITDRIKTKQPELKSKEDLKQRFDRGYHVQVQICQDGQDLDDNRDVLCFYERNEKLSSFLEMIKAAYNEFILKATDSCFILKLTLIELLEEDESKLQSSISYDDEKKRYLEIIMQSLNRAESLTRSNSNVNGLRIELMENFARFTLNRAT